MRTVLCWNPSGILIKKGNCHLFASFLHASGVRSTSERSQYAGASNWIRPSCTHLQAGALSLFEGLLDCIFLSRSQIRYTAVKWQSALLWGAKTLNYTVRLDYNISSAVTQAPYIRLYKQTVFVHNNARKLWAAAWQPESHNEIWGVVYESSLLRCYALSIVNICRRTEEP